MNAHHTLSRIATEFQPVSYSGWSYTMGLEDFSEIHATRTDAVSGRTWVFGRNKLGAVFSAPIGVPMCSGCNLPISDGLCTDCGLVFLGEAA